MLVSYLLSAARIWVDHSEADVGDIIFGILQQNGGRETYIVDDSTCRHTGRRVSSLHRNTDAQNVSEVSKRTYTADLICTSTHMSEVNAYDEIRTCSNIHGAHAGNGNSAQKYLNCASSASIRRICRRLIRILVCTNNTIHTSIDDPELYPFYAMIALHAALALYVSMPSQKYGVQSWTEACAIWVRIPGILPFCISLGRD